MKKGEKTISVLTMTLLCGALLLLMAGSPHDSEEESQVPTADTILVAPTDSCRVIYDQLGLSAWVDEAAFRKAYDGYCRIKDRKKEILTLIDFTKPSNEERLLVLDMAEGKLLFHSLVAHGRNSGDLYATRFSNRPESHQSSLGLYLTEGTYTGKNGYSLRLNGLSMHPHIRRMFPPVPARLQYQCHIFVQNSLREDTLSSLAPIFLYACLQNERADLLNFSWRILFSWQIVS